MTKPLFLARLAGTQAEIGAQHGRLVAEDARDLVEFYRTMPERQIVGGVTGPLAPIARLVTRGLATAWQGSLARSRPPELAARSRAFVEAAGARSPTIATWTMATMDSLQNCISAIARAGLGPFAAMRRSFGDDMYRRDLLGMPPLPGLGGRVAATAAPACTSVIAWGSATADGELLFARNFDFPGVGVWDAAPAFIVNAPTGGQRYGFFARRGADTAVVTVVNEAGLVIAPHTRWHLDAAWSGAMIVDIVHEIARKAETLADAVAIARSMPSSSTWGIAVGSAREQSGLVLEIAGPHLEVVRPPSGASYLICANRYRTPSLQERQVAASSAWALHSERRERRLRDLVETRTAPLTPESVARMLGNRCDVDTPDTVRRIGSTLAQPTNVHCAVVVPAHRRALVGVDQAPSCEGRWADLTWGWDGTTGGWEIDSLPATAGFTAHVRDDVAAPHDAATRLVHEATRTYEGTHDLVATRAAIDAAITHAPDDPSLWQAAAFLALEAGERGEAAARIEGALVRETDVYRRGQLLLWGARAIADRDPMRADAWRAELASMTSPLVAELQAVAARSYRRRPSVNLMMADAY